MAPSERKVRRVEYASSTDANNAGELTAAGWAVRSTNKRRPSPSLIVQRQRRTVGLSRRAACPQTLDQLSCLTANSADDRASPSPATWKRPSQSKPAKLPRSRVKKPLYGAEYFDCPLLIAVPK